MLENACDIAQLHFGGPLPQEFEDQWEIERRKALAILEEILHRFDDALIHFQIRRRLVHHVAYGKDHPGFHAECVRILSALRDTLELRIARTACQHYNDDFHGDRAKEQWEDFVGAVTADIHSVYQGGDAWLYYLNALDERWRRFEGFRPNFRFLLGSLSTTFPGEGVEAAESLLLLPNQPLAHTFDAIVLAATENDDSNRLRLILEASKSPEEWLRQGAVRCLTWWRTATALPDEGWTIIYSLASNATPQVANAVADFLNYNSKSAEPRDWLILLSVPIASDRSDVAGEIAARAADLIDQRVVQPPPESVDHFFRQFEALEVIEGHRMERAFAKLAEAFPAKVFWMLWRRNQARKAGDTSLQALPYDFTKIPFRRIMDDPEVKALVTKCEARLASGVELDFDEFRLLRAAIQWGCDDPSAWLEAAAQRAVSAEHLETLRLIGSVGDMDNPSLSFPKLTRALLLRARAIAEKCHATMFARLLHIGGVRGSTNNEPDDKWKSLEEAIEERAIEFGNDPELGPLYAAMLKTERSSMTFERSRDGLDEDS